MVHIHFSYRPTSFRNSHMGRAANKYKKANMSSSRLAKPKKRRISGSDDDSRETLFSIQPKDAHKIKEDRYREKEINPDRERDRIRETDRQRKDDRHRRDYYREKRDRFDRNKKSPARNEWSRKDDRDRRRPGQREREKSDWKDQKRNRSRSRTPQDLFEKRVMQSSSKSPESQRSQGSSQRSGTPKNVPEDAILFDRILDPNYKKKNDSVLAVEDVEMSPAELKEELEDGEIATFSFEENCGPARPTRVSTEPESEKSSPQDPDSQIATPMSPPTPEYTEGTSTTAMDDMLSDVDDEEEADQEEKYNKTPEQEEWEKLSETDVKKHKEAMQKRRDQRHLDAVAKLPVYYPGLKGCKHIAEYSILNVIAEGTYGVVFRGKNTRTDEVVALKRFKMEKEKEGFPITALREINMLLKAGSHQNVVNVKEILVGSTVMEVYMAMEYVEHDVKRLIDKMRERNQRFKAGQQKTLMLQLLSGMEHMHKLWILHRDLKTSNLLISRSGVLKIADFGLAREYGQAKDIETRMKLTPVVVTLWYRSPELLLEPKTYSTPIDMWSIGCIMAEFILMKPMFQGNNEPNQINQIFRMLGTPTEQSWPEVKDLRVWKLVQFDPVKPGELKKKFRGDKLLNETGFDLLSGLLSLNPNKRLTARDALDHDWFKEHPAPVPIEELPINMGKSEQNAAAPPKTANNKQNRLEALLAEEDPERAALLRQFNVRAEQVKPSGFQLKF